jgi:hypothetical protein
MERVADQSLISSASDIVVFQQEAKEHKQVRNVSLVGGNSVMSYKVPHFGYYAINNRLVLLHIHGKECSHAIESSPTISPKVWMALRKEEENISVINTFGVKSNSRQTTIQMDLSCFTNIQGWTSLVVIMIG